MDAWLSRLLPGNTSGKLPPLARIETRGKAKYSEQENTAGLVAGH